MSDSTDLYPVPTGPPRYDHPPAKMVTGRQVSGYALIDGGVTIIALALTLWLAALVLLRGLHWSWATVAYLVVFWGLLSYLALPRLHQLFTTLYVPDYFIGRARTADGLLGDPVNLALDGSAGDIHAAMTRAGWTLADEISTRSAWGIIASSLLRRSYPQAPVSSLYLFGRRQAFAYQQEVDGNAAQRHHVRFWPVPEGWVLPGGHRVGWLAAGTYDRSVGLSGFTGQITHKIDADIDVERDYIVGSVRWACPQVGVRVIRDFSTAYHHRNGGADLVRTDGNLPVLDVRGVAEPESFTPPAPAHHEHGVPPVPLLLIGGLTALKVLGLTLLWLVFAFATGEFRAELQANISGDNMAELVVTTIASVLALVLWVCTMLRQRWARSLLMISCAAEAVTQLAGSVESLSSTSVLGCGIAVLVLLGISADPVREWVSRGRRDLQVALELPR